MTVSVSPLPTLLAWTPSVWELGIILLIALLLFGNRLPSIARSMGKGITEFKKGLRGDEDEPKPPSRGAGEA
jgi:sec-independent protein translocase protein TatA